MLSIIIPARNEEKYISKCLNSVYNAANKVNLNIEAIVVCDCSFDKTRTIAESFGCRVFNVKYSSRSKTRNYGACQATGDFLVFIDADTTISEDFFLISFKNLNDSTNSFWYRIKPLEKNILASIYFFLYNFMSKFYPLLSPVIFTSKSYFLESGGFNEDLSSLEDHFFLHKAWRTNKCKFSIANVYTSVRRIKKYGILTTAIHTILAIKNPYEFKWSVINEYTTS